MRLAPGKGSRGKKEKKKMGIELAHRSPCLILSCVHNVANYNSAAQWLAFQSRYGYQCLFVFLHRYVGILFRVLYFFFSFIYINSSSLSRVSLA